MSTKHQVYKSRATASALLSRVACEGTPIKILVCCAATNASAISKCSHEIKLTRYAGTFLQKLSKVYLSSCWRRQGVDTSLHVDAIDGAVVEDLVRIVTPVISCTHQCRALP